MKPNISVITIGVEDLEKAVAFYRDGLGLPTEGVVGQEFEHDAVAFFDLQAGLKLAVWKLEDIAFETKVAQTPNSSTEFILGHNVGSVEDVDSVLAKAAKAGAIIVDSAHHTFWGGYSGHFRGSVWNPA